MRTFECDKLRRVHIAMVNMNLLSGLFIRLNAAVIGQTKRILFSSQNNAGAYTTLCIYFRTQFCIQF